MKRMKDTFLKYLEDWKESVANKEGSYTPAEREMFLSRQAYEGLKITPNSHTETIKFVLSTWFSYVLSERFMQDVLEEYFGHQRTLGGRSDNPSAQQFTYKD